MASLIKGHDGLRRLEFTLNPKGPRKRLHLGRMSDKAAADWKAHVEALIVARAFHRVHDPRLARWLTTLDHKWLRKLQKVGLADSDTIGGESTTLGAFLDEFFKGLTGKPGTRVFYSHTRANLESHFGPSCVLRSIKPKDADRFRAWLATPKDVPGEPGGAGLSPATVARRIIACRTMWRRAIRWKHADENPFEGIKAGHQANDARKQFIPPAAIDAIIDECPDLEWRVIIALARYGGLRTPSETFALRWRDIDWARGMITVRVAKLEHIERLARRTVPLFPQLRKHLSDLWDSLEAGGPEYVIVRNRLDGMNLRTQFERLIARAGQTPWPRLFHNLRASRESELMREYDLATVCKWIGNSPAIAATHYATSIDLDADFARAAALTAQAAHPAQNPAQTTPDAAGPDGTSDAGCKAENAETAGFNYTSEGQGDGRYWIRTSDLVRVEHAL